MKYSQRMRKVRRVSIIVVAALNLSMVVGCDLDTKTQAFISDTVDNIVQTFTQEFLVTPINNFINNQVDNVLDQLSNNP